jgi:hypothetical protein
VAGEGFRAEIPLLGGAVVGLLKTKDKSKKIKVKRS